MNFVPLAFYAAALVAYALHFTRRQATVGRTATTLLVFAALAHTFVIGMQTMEVGHVPFANASAATSTLRPAPRARLSLRRDDDRRAGDGRLHPAAAGGAAGRFPAFRPGHEERAALLWGPLFNLHVSSLLFAYASFALACVIGITYVLLFKEIKAKHLGFFYTRLPSLQVLDSMNQRAIVVGWVFLTIGIVVGAVWTAQVRGTAPGDPRVQAMSLQDPKILVALVSWAIYSFEAFAARRIGWGGRRTAYLSALGFVIVLLNLVPISYFLTRSHDF